MWRRLLVAAVAVAGWLPISAVARWAVSDATRDLRGPGTPSLDTVITGAAGALAWAAATWLTAGLLLLVVASLPGRAAEFAGRLAERITPDLLRRSAAALLGASMLTGGYASAAVAADRPPVAVSGRAPAGPTAVASSAPLPAMDRPVMDRPARDRVSSSPAAAREEPSNAGEARAAPGRTAQGQRRSSAAAERSHARPPAASEPTRARPRASTGTDWLTPAPVRRPVGPDEIVVRAGDTLWGIAARELGPAATAADVAAEWPRWYAANRDVIGSDPGLIRPGQVLHRPR